MLFKNISIVDESFQVLTEMYLLTQQEHITYIGKEHPASQGIDCRNEAIYEGKNKVILPAFFNTHCHVPMVLLRGFGEGLSLQAWLQDKIFPYEARLQGEDCYWATLLGCMEMLRSGTCAFTDMYFYLDYIAQACEEAGIKANLSYGLNLTEKTKSLKNHPGLKETEALLRQTRSSQSDKIKVDVGLHAEYSASPSLIKEIAAYAQLENLSIHTHLAETKKEYEDCKRKYNCSSIALMEQAGIFQQPVNAAHCVWLEDEDYLIFKKAKVFVAHCISSNLKLGSGIAPLQKLLEENINLTIGTDGAASNNNLNMLEEMQLVSLVHKGINHDAKFLGPKQILKMATLEGAQAQGRVDSGSLKVGHKADLCVFDFNHIQLQPLHDVLANLIYAADASNICLTMVDGNITYQNGEFPQLDEERILYEVTKINQRILKEL